MNTKEINASTKKATRAERELRQSAFCSNFSTKLLRLISKKGINQNTLADAIGLTSGAISNYATSKRAPAYPDFFLICEYFGVSADYFNPTVSEKDWEKYLVRKETRTESIEELEFRDRYLKQICDLLGTLPVSKLSHIWEFLNYMLNMKA